jgi:group I intron endonuclease
MSKTKDLKGSGVYRITNTETGKIYIGSSVNLRKRCYEHFRLLGLNKHHCTHLQNSFNTYGIDKFIVETIEQVDIEGLNLEERDKKLLAREQYWLDATKCYKSDIGYNSSSLADKVSMTPETRAKIGAGRLGKLHTEESKAKMAASSRGRSPSEETRKKMSEANKGRKISDWHRQRISESKKGIPRSEETRRKVSEARRGTKASAEARAKMSASQLGRRHTEESRRKISETKRAIAKAKREAKEEA